VGASKAAELPKCEMCCDCCAVPARCSPCTLLDEVLQPLVVQILTAPLIMGLREEGREGGGAAGEGGGKTVCVGWVGGGLGEGGDTSAGRGCAAQLET